jgi:hypothetical protein
VDGFNNLTTRPNVNPLCVFLVALVAFLLTFLYYNLKMYTIEKSQKKCNQCNQKNTQRINVWSCGQIVKPIHLEKLVNPSTLNPAIIIGNFVYTREKSLVVKLLKPPQIVKASALKKLLKQASCPP